MNTKLYAVFLTVFVFLSQPAFLCARQTQDNSDWMSVQSIAAGTEISVETKEGKRLKGMVSSVSATNIVVTAKNGAQTIERSNVRRLYQIERNGSRTKSTAIGAAVGAGVGGGGAAVLLGATGGSDSASSIVATGLGIGAAAGAALGYLVGKGSKKTLIYKSL